MTTPNLGKIEQVSNLRDTWPNEAQNFTPWLAENLDQLGDALGMELDLQQIEAAVGGYSLDILATDLNGNRPVIIENQLETTDHVHLGQLLTYAAGFDAEAIVWVTKEFRDEHRQALDWLNQRTGEETRFFGVVVELWRIGNSPLAPHFRLVATPNDWGKKKTGGAGSTSERSERYRSFFQSPIESLPKQKFNTARNARGRSWFSFPTGFRGTSYAAAFTSGNQVKVELYIDIGTAEQNLALLEDLKSLGSEFELTLGKLDWQRLDSRRACRVALNRSGSIDGGAGELAELQVWMSDNLVRFKELFEPLLSELILQQSPTQEQSTLE